MLIILIPLPWVCYLQYAYIAQSIPHSTHFKSENGSSIIGSAETLALALSTTQCQAAEDHNPKSQPHLSLHILCVWKVAGSSPNEVDFFN
jgi:hypothetical protein